jgi:ATP-dependent Clp protease ATP-binding subunit ClpC
MNDNITPRLDKVLKNAKKEAIKLGNDYVGLEHVVIALIDADTGPIRKVLTNTGVALEKIKEALQKKITPETKKDVTASLVAFNKELEAALVKAKEIAEKFEVPFVGTEHTFIAILDSGETGANLVLKSLGIDIQTLRTSLVEEVEASKKKPTPEKIPAGGAKAETKEDKETTIGKYSIDLTAKAAKGEIDPVIGRTEEVKRAIHILSRKKKNNPVLVGPPGVGKTSIVEGLAIRIHKKEVPIQLQDKRVFALDLGLLVAGTVYRGQFEERVKKILKEVKDNPDFIVFIDELHTVIGAGAAEGAMDVSNMFKPALARGEFKCIGATTEEEYRRYVERDAALERRFQKVKVEEPNEKDTVEILRGAAKTYEEFHGVKYAPGVVEHIVAVSNRYVTDRFQPDKGFDLLDESGAMVKLGFNGSSEELRDMQLKLIEAHTKCGEHMENRRIEEAKKLREEIARLEHKTTVLKTQEQKAGLTVTTDHINAIVSHWTGIPVGDLTATETQKLVHIDDTLGNVVISQTDAITTVARALKKSKTPLKDPRRPIGSFLFVGPTGVGKTLLAKAIATKMFGTDKNLLELDMSEYSDGTAVNKLIGSSAGYVGYEDGAKLLRFVKNKPYSVILFDEIEKAHPDVIQTLLQIMEEGRLTDNHGKTIDFRNTVIIMTSNLGVEAAKSMGFGSSQEKAVRARDNMIEEIKKRLRPEFLNRLQLVFFNPLSKDDARKVVDLEIAALNKRIEESKVRIERTDAVVDFLVNNGYNERYGARNIRSQIEKHMEDALTDDFLTGQVPENSVILFDVVDGKLTHKLKA